MLKPSAVDTAPPYWDCRGGWIKRHLDIYWAGPEGEGTSVAFAVALVADPVALGQGMEDGALAAGAHFKIESET